MSDPVFVLTVTKDGRDAGWDLLIEWVDGDGRPWRRTGWSSALTERGAMRDAKKRAKTIYRREILKVDPGARREVWRP